MEQSTRKIKWVIRGGLAFVGALLIPMFLLVEFRQHSHSAKPLPDYGQIADFTLADQNGKLVSLADLRGHVWIADVIFTRCAGSCPHMSHQMKVLQQALPAGSHVKLVSLTTDPTFDTPPVLKRYAQRFDADPNRWLFLTGPQQEIRHLAVDSLKLSALPKNAAERSSPEDLFIHSTIFVVVGKQGHLRGIFETGGEGVDPQQVTPQILATVSQLERES